MGRLWRVRVSGPLEVFAAGFREELECQGYSPWTVIAAVELMEHLSGWLVARRLGPSGLVAAEVDQFVRDRRGSGQIRRRSPKGLMPLLGYLRGLGVVPEAAAPFADGSLEGLLTEFALILSVGVAWLQGRSAITETSRSGSCLRVNGATQRAVSNSAA